MLSASQFVYAHCGAPEVADTQIYDEFVCWVCGAKAHLGRTVRKWMGANFVGQNRVRAPESGHVCAACIHVMGGRPPDTLRMYSHLVDDRGWLKLNKGDKPKMREWLRGPKQGQWLAAIADSGQKHTIPWCPINPPNARAGRVMFEETEVTIPADPDEGWWLLDWMADLLTAGATKEEIQRGDYGPGAWQRCESLIRDFERAWSKRRHSGWFDLALWLAQRDEEKVAARLEAEKAERESKKERQRDRRKAERKTSKRNHRDAARDQVGVPANTKSKRAETLSAHTRSPASGGKDDGESGGVGNHDGQVPSAKGSQLSLF